MRADPHYVRAAVVGQAAPNARAATEGRRESRRRNRREGPREGSSRAIRNSRPFRAHRASAASSITSSRKSPRSNPRRRCSAGDASPLTRRVSLDLIKAQAARAAWLLRAQAIVAGAAPELSPRTRQVGVLLGQLRDRLAAECRLVGVGLQVAAESHAIGHGGRWRARARRDRRRRGAAAVHVGRRRRRHPHRGHRRRRRRRRRPAGHRDLAGYGHPVRRRARQRFFDADWQDRPGGWLAATGAAVGQATAERLGGRASLATGAGAAAPFASVLPDFQGFLRA